MQAVILVMVLVIYSGCSASTPLGGLSAGDKSFQAASIEIISTNPSKPYKQIGNVEATGNVDSENQVMEKLQEQARSLGAEAIILKSKEVKEKPLKYRFSPLLGDTYMEHGPSKIIVLKGVAIKYE
jgi:hypothetical protein